MRRTDGRRLSDRQRSLDQSRHASQSAPAQGAPQTPERTSMKLARPALMNRQHGANLTQAEIAGIAEPHHRAMTRRETSHFLTQNRRTLAARHQGVRRAVRRCWKQPFQIRVVLDRGAADIDLSATTAGASPHSVEHLAANSKFRITGKRRSNFRGKGAGCLEKSQISGLNQVGHLDAGSRRETRENSGGKYPHQTAHRLVRGFRRAGTPVRAQIVQTLGLIRNSRRAP